VFKTKMTELFRIKHPIMLAGMNWITNPKLVAHVCNAGGLGMLAVAQFSPDDTRKAIKEIRKLTDKPFGVNQILIGPGAKENIQVAIEEKVPIINYALGKPWFIDQVHAYGGKVMGTTAIARHAVRAEQLGCDAVVITGREAAAHGADATSLVLIPIVTNHVKIPVIAAGGFHDGRGLAAALALGASGISMGTRFMMTKECCLHDNFKQLCLKATEQDTVYSNRFDGMDGRALKSKGSEALMKKGFPLAEATSAAIEIKRLFKLSWGQFIGLSFQMMRAEEGSPLWVQARQAVAAKRSLLAIEKGDTEQGFLFAGQDCGAIEDIPSVKELIERIIAQAEETLEVTRQKIVKN